jgi:deoxyribodipyrimidine photo-lyase
MRALVWFRADLRVRDNPALYYATHEADRGVIAVFTICPDQWRVHDWGATKINFVLRNLAALSQELERSNIPLRIVKTTTFSDVPNKLLQLATRHACDALYFNREYEVNEARRDERVSTLFEENSRSVYAYHDQLVLPPGKVQKDNGTYYTVFTPFKRKWCERYTAEDGRVLPGPKRQPEFALKPSHVPQYLGGFARTDRPDLWPEGEKRARARLTRFIDRRIDGYNELRDFPAQNGTSTLSPYLANGVISARQCLQAALDVNNGRLVSGNKGISTWISELIWREFYRHILVAFPRVCMNKPFQPQTEKVPWRYDEGQFQAWCEGRTGVPIVDAGMRQLNQTGWMHNRVRMIVAMFLTKNLLIAWRWGERYFMEHLVDGDFASNNGGWQWSASTGTDAAPYFRIFNPYSQSQKFDPDGEYLRRFVSELDEVEGEAVHNPHGSPHLCPAGFDYPQPIVDVSKTRRRAIEAFSNRGRKTPAAVAGEARP